MAHVLGKCFFIWPIKRYYNLMEEQEAEDEVKDEEIEEAIPSESFENEKSYTNSIY